MVDKNSLNIIAEYSNLINNIVSEFSCDERTIIERPNIGTVLDGCKRFHADECKKMLAELVTEYYSAKNTNKITEYKLILKSRLENEYNYENGNRTTETIAKNWAVQSVIRKLECAEKNLLNKLN